VWQATIRLLQALDAWQDWFRKLRAEGDADPACALWCQETAIQCIHVLCTHRVNMPPFDREDEAAILAMLPPIPDWAMAGTGDRWDDDQDQFVPYQRPRWQDDRQFRQRYYCGPEHRCTTATRLRGATLQLRLLLESFPMTALGSDRPAAPSPAEQPQIERINHLHCLAARGVKVVRRLQTLLHCADGDHHARDALLQLQLAVNEVAALPLTDDPFSADEVVEAAGVVATSMHAAAFAITQRTWQTVQLRSLALEIRSDHQDGSGQSSKRVTSPLRVAPTEVPWSADVWDEVRRQLAEDPSLDLERIETRLALERIQAVRRLEARCSVHGTGTVASATKVESTEPNSTGSPSPAVPQQAEPGRSDAFADAESSQSSALGFIPSDLQERILEALDQKALTLDALVSKLHVDRRTLHRNGIKELMQLGMIGNDRRVGGYYRPDAPPPKYAEKLRRRAR
jgi:hypothetical protein